MSILKYIMRLERIHLLIKHGSTGNIESFSEKMGLSRRQLLEELSDLKQLGAPIKFESCRQSYVYEYDWSPLVKISDERSLSKVRGGMGRLIHEASICFRFWPKNASLWL